MTSVILQTAGRTLFHTLIVFSLFLLFAGHDNPGGGFIGGLVAGSALVLRYLAEGPDDLARLVPGSAAVLVGVGLVCATSAGVLGLVTGHGPLGAVHAGFGLPLVGEIHLSSVLLFDAGVYLIVIGMVDAVLETLGGEIDA